ncbi:MAG TPA: cbb3-type cytochrome c oxidase subunit 3 [Alphaproteobacteria bacterium]|mgnify:CR=1 FL=1|jgi:cbb3-type cytochrome oxidase subunit 3|nr:cbb3-type cytochrome c oxidase subunit 3 [Alphaproteobacteria bacterium]
MDYHTIQSIAGTTGLLIFIGVFVVVLVRTFRPGAKKSYDETARIIFKEDESHG